ncbi:MAG: carbamoyltransferase HypF, partial [Chloroflexi bacterium]|nr:carbamoyltransferase HypF [Chloroflexota bacterium]
LPGGSLAIRRPYRIALGYILALPGEDHLSSRLGFINSMNQEEFELVKKQVQNMVNSPLTSSMGRLFDAVSAMAGIRGVIDYEAQAAIEMEMKANDAGDEKGTYPFSDTNREGYHIILLHDLVAAVLDDLIKGCPTSVISMRFHNTIAALTRDICLRIKEEQAGLNAVALSGGCFQNRLLLVKVIQSLRAAGFTVLTHRQVPCNDGGISLGQAVIAAMGNDKH